jgi:two-component system CheB/CheR fusion protein
LVKRRSAAPGKKASVASPAREAHATQLRVIGIGASAGGLDAFRELLQHLPADTGMAFVMVQHLAPDQKSMLPEILSRSTTMPVHELAEATPVLPDHVYVMSPRMDVEYAHGALVVRKRGTAKRHMPVDRLFTSLAKGLGELAVGVILSGTAGDGTAGAQSIKRVGGMTFAQDESAQFGGMPQSAIEHGAVDFILSPKEIARKLAEIAGSSATSSLESPQHAVRELDRIIGLLSASDRIDFLHYKTPTIERRIQRRMLLRNAKSLAAYRRLLEEDAAELEALYHDVLIGVTRFFRDPTRTAALRKQVFPLLLESSTNDVLRFWVPACSTGEEVYSLAILFAEYVAEKKLNRHVQIFGSDINEESIAFARAGIYPPSIENSVSPERLRRFFVPGPGGGHTVSRTIRELCVFAEHNLLKDPPFSRLDLISCSNLLIYLQPAQQERVAATFCYALNGNGILMLGPSESLRSSGDGFVVVDKKHKLFRVAPGPRPRLAMPHAASARRGVSSPPADTGHAAPEDPVRMVDQLLLARYAPAALVINDASEVIEFRGELQRFLAPASGTPSFKLSKLIHADLLIDVRTALFKARHSVEPVRREHIKMKVGTETRLVNIEVLPAPRRGTDGVWVVTFEEVGPAAESAAGQNAPAQMETQRLEEALAAARGYLAHLTTEHEQSDSVLHATGEALQSANEELQSTVEELETAKEELQSTNEELSTLNDELRLRNVDLVVAGDDLMNLLSSIDTPVIMVDRDLVIRLFNPTAERLFSFQQTDSGRPIAAFKPLMELPDLMEILHRVIHTPATVESDVQSDDGHWYSLRVRPYRSSRNEIAGAVITLIDTHELRSALQTAEESRDLSEQARSIAEEARTEALDANRLKDEFLSTLSHELRTPMTSILGWAQMMRMIALDPETMATAISTIERGTQAQIRLIDDLLDISRITTGRLRLEQRSFRLPSLIEETLDVVRPALEAKKIDVHKDLDDAPALLYGDPDRLRQVIWNLLSNAVKFTPEKGTIEVTATKEKGAAVIRVRDSGEGIPAGFLPHSFERFSQSESGTKRAKSGLGLGLAISKYVVDLHGGTIVATSDGAGQGSLFTVTLPLVPYAEDFAAALPQLPAGELPRLHGKTVLVVDDDGDSRKLVAVALEHCGATVITAKSVKMAMSALEGATPHVIISDIAMPAEDGIDLIRRVRALPAPYQKVPMVALTAFTSDDDRRRVLSAGFAEHLSKPVAPLELLRVVAAFANG